MRTKEKGKLGAPQGKRENGGAVFWVRIPLGNQTARTHAHTNETKQFSGWKPPTSYVWKSPKVMA